ncbi:MAG: hypothetical protein A3H59_03400 [Candidatus Jacksonbacteria bacterium RIFCSPLOWO2_02_FULL_43_9]|nr:MAG: hypothetical protein A2986_01685 [Candidatus Jacksonbacteria bacterium RIFCSPLOWO2_01_FULL_44_13]OGY73703.1 MAG: hypothetical protein A3H59_03400 [Candidatus Jacksonbacteria bacterium RIFCSPLOWO2_02_FULL_43_9]HAZ16598.1 hypothetical protein [Candidatus Jacksonbacteria bacterium]
MYNWSTDTTALKKGKKQYAKWRLEQLINFGIGKEKLSMQELRKYWDTLNIDPHRREFLNLFIHDKENSYRIPKKSH